MAVRGRWWKRPVSVFRGRGAAAVVVAALLLAGSGRARTAGAEDLRLSEFLAGPARDWTGDGVTDARGDEWIEVVNTGAAPLELAAFRLADADSTIRFAFSGTLLPGAYLLVTGQQAVDWQRSQGRSATGLSLNNAGDTVRLFRVSEVDTVQIDAKVYNSIEGASDRSAGRLDPALDSWSLYDALNPYNGAGEPKGTGCPPTPGVPNGCTTGTRRTTWGVIKDLYR